uniref:Uncharacterized protein n=1 Tax=Cacopsylla melanoneura TaxID=428564 RepID=A0A8D9E4U3_9HEMI
MLLQVCTRTRTTRSASWPAPHPVSQPAPHSLAGASFTPDPTHNCPHPCCGLNHTRTRRRGVWRCLSGSLTRVCERRLWTNRIRFSTPRTTPREWKRASPHWMTLWI